MIRAAIFDLDGTLVSFSFDVQGSRRAILEELEGRGFDTRGFTLNLPTQDMIDEAKRQIESGAVRQNYEDVRRSIYLLLDRFELEGSKRSAPFDDTRPTLEELRRRGIKLAVVTNSGRLATTGLLTRYDLARYFEFVLTRDDVDHLKPHPDGLEKAVARLGLPSSRVVFVGDSVLDITAAKRAGLGVVSVATGNFRAEKLQAEGADVVLTRISELTGYLDGREPAGHK